MYEELLASISTHSSGQGGYQKLIPGGQGRIDSRDRSTLFFYFLLYYFVICFLDLSF